MCSRMQCGERVETEALIEIIRQLVSWHNNGGLIMGKLGRLAICLIAAAVICGAQDVVSIVHGTVKKVDSATKTIVVKTADGTEHTIN
jgi:hypothetical protein